MKDHIKYIVIFGALGLSIQMVPGDDWEPSNWQEQELFARNAELADEGDQDDAFNYKKDFKNADLINPEVLNVYGVEPEAAWIKTYREDVVPGLSRAFDDNRGGGTLGRDRVRNVLGSLPDYIGKWGKSSIRLNNLTNLLDYYQDEKSAKVAYDILDKLRLLSVDQKLAVLDSIRPEHYS